jgi:cytochrome P450 PksS
MGLFAWLTRTGRSAQEAINLASPEFKANPYPYYARLRAGSPVVRVTLPTGEPGWLITRYADAVMVLKDERFVKNPANALTPEQVAGQRWFRKVFVSLRRNMLNLDPPDHTRLRALVQKAFTPRMVEQLRPRIEALTNDLLDAVQGQGRMDLIRDYALPLPATVIAEMLGVPAKDRHRFHRWSNALLAFSSTWGLMKAVPNTMLLMRYIRTIIRRRRANPGNDLVSALIQAEEAGEQLSEDELSAMIMLLLVAGHETTVNLIGNGTLALLEHPDQMEKLRGDPALARPAVEELLRYTSPVEMATERFAREDITVAGVTIPRGEMVFVVLASANRDERQFPQADTLDITREPNKHLAFGLGTHFCLGAVLARLEATVALNTLLGRTSKLRLAVAPSALPWRRGLLLRGLESLPVVFAKKISDRSETDSGR